MLLITAQQEAERARFLVEKVCLSTFLLFVLYYCCCFQAEQYKLAAIISAEGDSRAAELLAKSFVDAGDGLIELRKLEAAEEIAATLSRSRNVAYLPGSGQNLLLNIPT